MKLVIALLLGLVSGGVCFWYRSWLYPGSGDFGWALRTASVLLAGGDPYAFEPTTRTIPYPLPVALFGLPVMWLPAVAASVVFIGLSTAALAYGILRYDKPWRLLGLISSPFVYAVMYAQWSPLVTAAWFLPVIGPLLVLVKPQIALPVALLKRSYDGFVVASVVLWLSLVIYPIWPIRWLGMIREYEYILPIATLPFGPLLLLSLLSFNRPEGKLLAAISVLPFRGAYDLLALSLVPQTCWQMVVWVVVSLLLPFFVGPGWSTMLFLPTLGILLWDHAKSKNWRSWSLRSLLLRS